MFFFFCCCFNFAAALNVFYHTSYILCPSYIYTSVTFESFYIYDFIFMCGLSSSRSPQWRGARGNPSGWLNQLNPHLSHIVHINYLFQIFRLKFAAGIVFALFHTLISSIFYCPVKSCIFPHCGKFDPLCIEGPRTEDEVNCRLQIVL